MDLSKMDVRRFGTHYRSQAIRARAGPRDLRKHYDVKYPSEDYRPDGR